MKRWLAKLFGTKNAAKQTGERELFPRPWENHRLSIYRFLSPYAQGSEPLPESAQTLPDENIQEGELRWVAGGMDGAFGHHCGSSAVTEIAEQLVRALSAVLLQTSQDNMQQLYKLLKDGSPLDYIDILMEKLPQESSLPVQKVHDLIVWLAMESPDRNPVKFAIALLAYFPSEQNRALVTTLGLHEEFTLFSAVALRNMLPTESHESALVDLAKRVTGWGRIQLIERLPDEISATSRDWLLHEGYSNSVMTEYTAWDCAIKGKLLSALMDEAVDAKLLLGAGEILSALISGGPAVYDMHNYKEGAQVCHRYLALLKQSVDDDVRNLLNAKAISEFASNDDNGWDTLVSHGWSDDIRQKIKEDVQAILAQPKWREKVNTDLSVSDNPTFYFTIRAARLLEIDPWNVLFSRQSATTEEDNWYQLMQTDDPKRIEQILVLAESQLDLAAIATGPDTQMGIGPAYRMHSALDFILQDLKRFPGMGWTLIKTGLRSPVIRNRHMALNALESWSQEQRPPELRELLEAAYQQESEKKVRERLEEAMAKRNDV